MKHPYILVFFLFFFGGFNVSRSQTLVAEKVKQNAFEPDSLITLTPDSNSPAGGNLKIMAKNANESASIHSVTQPSTEFIPPNGTPANSSLTTLKKSKN